MSANAMPAGLSGARVFQCKSEKHGLLALRCWPPSVSKQRINEVHQVQFVATQAGCHFVPQLLPIGKGGQANASFPAAFPSAFPAAFPAADFQANGWELANWMPGTPLPADASIEDIVAGAKLIGEFHRSVARLGQPTKRAPCVLARLERIAKLNQILPAAFQDSRPASDGPLPNALMRSRQILQQNWHLVAPSISRSFNRYACETYATQYVLRDVHREHVLFANSVPSGLIDFDAIRVDLPLTDLVRWAGSFRVFQADAFETILAGYEAGSSFHDLVADKQLQLAKELHRSGIWISLANWLVWIVIENRQFVGQDEQIANRIDTLIEMAVRLP